jgi:hypothetical protein
MGFDINVIISAKIDVDRDEFIEAVIMLSSLYKYDIPNKGQFIGDNNNIIWTVDDMINDWKQQDIWDQDGDKLVISEIIKNFYKARGTKTISPNDFDFGKQSLIEFLRKIEDGQYNGPRTKILTTDSKYIVLPKDKANENESNESDEANESDEIFETKDGARAYLHSLIHEIEINNTWTINVDMS